jgi:hypothetical protein
MSDWDKKDYEIYPLHESNDIYCVNDKNTEFDEIIREKNQRKFRNDEDTLKKVLKKMDLKI